MRTEVKLGLVFGLVVIAAVAVYFFRTGESGQKADRIPFDVRQAAGDKAESAAGSPPALAKRPSASGTRREAAPRVTRRSPRRPAPAEPRTGTPPSVPGRPAQPGVSPTKGVPAGPVTTRRERPSGPATRPAGGEPGPEIPRPRTQPVLPPDVSGRPLVGLPKSPVVPPPSRSERVKEAPKPAPAPAKYVVQPGDTLSSIAREHYGHERYWTRIRDANPDIDPDHILPGQELVLPPKEAAAGETAPSPKREPQPKTAGPSVGRATYVVERGDTLISIARYVLGDASRWREIYELNKDRIEDPDKLLVGQELRMPPLKPARPKP